MSNTTAEDKVRIRNYIQQQIGDYEIMRDACVRTHTYLDTLGAHEAADAAHRERREIWQRKIDQLKAKL